MKNFLFYRIIMTGVDRMHNFKNRIIIIIITGILATIATKIYYWNSLDMSRVWFIFCLFILILSTYGLVVSYIIDKLASYFDLQIIKILIRILLFLVAGILPFIGSDFIILTIITAIIYVLVDALYPLPKKERHA